MKKDTIARVRSDYLLPYQEFMEQQELIIVRLLLMRFPLQKKKDAQRKEEIT